MPVYLLDQYSLQFPDPLGADATGLVAVGGDLSPERLLQAYSNGIFPWFESWDGAIYWYSTNPRCVLFPTDLKVKKSMRSIFNQNKFRYSIDTNFEAVMRACAETKRAHEKGTWISDGFIEGYSQLNQQGYAHSMEVWEGTKLVGGLYGVSLGQFFFGESMFSLRPNASKAGFITLVRALEKHNFTLIDCQQKTDHLVSLGATTIEQDVFQELILQNNHKKTLRGHWKLDDALDLICTPI